MNIDNYGIPHFKMRKFQYGGKYTDNRQEYIDDINEWAKTNPTKVFLDNFSQQRRYLTDDTWNYIASNMSEKDLDKYFNAGKLPRRIYDKHIAQDMRKRYEDAGNTFGKVVMTGVTLTPIGAAGEALYSIASPFIEGRDITGRDVGTISAGLLAATPVGKGIKLGKRVLTFGKIADKATDTAKAIDTTTDVAEDIAKTATKTTDKATDVAEKAVQETIEQVNPTGIPKYKSRKLRLNKPWNKEWRDTRWKEQIAEDLADKGGEKLQTLIDDFNNSVGTDKWDDFLRKYKLEGTEEDIRNTLKMLVKEYRPFILNNKTGRLKYLNPELDEILKQREALESQILPELERKRLNKMWASDISKLVGTGYIGAKALDLTGDAAGWWGEKGMFGSGEPYEYKKEDVDEGFNYWLKDEY